MHYHYHFLFSGHTLQHVAIEFSYQGSNTHPPAFEAYSLNHPTTREVLLPFSHGNYTIFQLNIFIVIE